MGRLERLRSFELPGGLRVHEARGPRARLLGLALLSELPRGHALLIPRCRSVHTFGMRFELDVVFIGEDLHVVHGVAAGRVLCERRAAHVLETRAGEGDRFVTALSGTSVFR